jgi:hypothetical protein
VELEAAYRRGNDAIADALRRAGLDHVEVDFVCECADAACLARVPLTLKDYERIRGEGGPVTLPDHAVSGRP